VKVTKPQDSLYVCLSANERLEYRGPDFVVKRRNKKAPLPLVLETPQRWTFVSLSPLCIDNPRQLEYQPGGRHGPNACRGCCQFAPGKSLSHALEIERYWRKPHNGAFDRSGRRGIPQRVGNV